MLRRHVDRLAWVEQLHAGRDHATSRIQPFGEDHRPGQVAAHRHRLQRRAVLVVQHPDARLSARFEERARKDRETRRPGAGSEERASGSDAGEELSYRSVFYKFLATGADLASLEPEERAVLKAGVQLGEEYRAQSSATGA